MRNFEQPGRSLAVGRSGMAATSHPTATLTAVEVLKAGGTAMDAAVAACAVQCVVEAGSTGIGGDCFALIAKDGRDPVLAYNGSGRTPAGLTLDRLVARGVTAIARTSPHAVTVPGAIDAWARLVADHGRMPLADVLAPAVALARGGYPITPRVARDIGTQAELLRADPTTRATFLVDGNPPPIGALQTQPRLADTLEAIGRDGRDAFYRGSVAEDMVATLEARGGFHTLDDFAAAAGAYVAPVRTDYRGYTVHECPPNGQGIVALMILNILKRFPPRTDPEDFDGIAVEIEAARLAYAVRDGVVGDPDGGPVPVDDLLSDALADRLAAMIDPARAIAALPAYEAPAHRDTVYIAVVDKDRTAVSFINSIFDSYGSGIMAPKSGVLLHNRGQSFRVEAGHPNAVGPRKRPLHTIIPGMVTKDGQAVMPFGVMGGHYQAMGHAVLLARVFDQGLDLQSAMELPRLFPFPGTAIVEAEGRLLASHGPDLARRGYDVRPARGPIGGSQAILIDAATGSLFGGSDHRKDGCALGY